MIERYTLAKEGETGDCYRTCIACLLDLEPEQVPHFTDGMSTHANTMLEVCSDVDCWLYDWGMKLLRFPFAGSLDEVLRVVGGFNHDAEYILSGISENGESHSVVARGSRIVWNPNKHGTKIIGPCKTSYGNDAYYLEFMVPSGCKPLWIVGKWLGPGQWDFQGVYNDEDKAKKACIFSNNFIGPATLNEQLPDDQQDWPGAYYPREWKKK